MSPETALAPPTPAEPPPGEQARHSIGEAAARVGVSTRTLRYYQELGLLDPAGSSPGGNRRYSDADLARVERIKVLREVMGFDLDRIGDILGAEDRLADLRREVNRGVSTRRRREIVDEAISINGRLREHVVERQAALAEFAAELKEKATRYRRIARELAQEEGRGDAAG